jgi:hypothetical protein
MVNWRFVTSTLLRRWNWIKFQDEKQIPNKKTVILANVFWVGGGGGH